MTLDATLRSPFKEPALLLAPLILGACWMNCDCKRGETADVKKTSVGRALGTSSTANNSFCDT